MLKLLISFIKFIWVSFLFVIALALLIPFFIIYCIYDGFFPCDPIQKIVDQLRGKKEKTPKEKFKDVLSKLGECTFNVLMFPALVCMICVIVILCPIKSFNAFTASFPKWF